MKTAAKIFLIIGMVFGFWTILPLVFGFMTLGKMKRNEEIPMWLKVCDILFVNVIGGILLLVDKD